MNPLSWFSGIFGGIFGGSNGQPATGTINIQTIMAMLAVAEAFGVNPASLSPAQMAAISTLLTALGYAVPAPAVTPHA